MKKDLDGLLEQAVVNVKSDRALAMSLLTDLMKHLKVDDSRHQQVGAVAAKYLETLQRSNEQLVKVSALVQKKQSASTVLSEADKSEIFDLLNEENK